ncbi:ketopantoate reductase family protein [Falsiroseomonas selenitidurans]|uniref:2-dehydropantoate 2-reductase n=1 Tax=Falsiroseomonas selenitidurans TaxID=2716335 RepID=A0ABX1EB14_9PROT|nr:2-dehydropantoate 2-reductase [Falsiroseomonas selenitidurans]NKC34181.1 2-dehydropantoate 2-reductase [Falsiroseomonas selenitidurans]
MKICVFGAGAIGGHLAGRLARGGAEVSLVARGAHLAAIQAKGLTVQAHDGTHVSHPKASADPAALGPQDAVIVTVKAPALPAVAAGIAPLLGPDTAVAFVMNGIPWWYFLGQGAPKGEGLAGLRLPGIDPEGALERAVGLHRTIGGVVYSASEVVAPGVVHSEHGNIRVILGEPDGTVTDRALAIAARLEAGGMPCPVTPDIRAAVWAKLLGNLSSGPLCVLARRGVRDTMAEPVLRATARLVAEEGRAIAAALGVALPVADVDRVARSNMLHKPSILQDLELGRPMEIESLFEVPLQLARATGTPTPQLDLLVALAKQTARAAGLYPEIA